MTTPWAYLPNAERIDQILAHLRQHPRSWVGVPHQTFGPAWTAARQTAWKASKWEAWDGAAVAARGEPRILARAAIAALTAWDDCAPILDMPADAVRLLAAVGHHPAVLLLPAVLAMNGETR